MVAQASLEMSEALDGWNALALNPVNSEIIAAASKNFVKREESDISKNLATVQIWKMNESTLGNMAHKVGLKRQKTEVSTWEPAQCI